MSKPLTKLMGGKDTDFQWDTEQEVAFQKVKDALCNENVLLMPDLKKPFVILTDASHVGLGAVLCQDAPVWCDKKQGMIVKPRPVAFASRVLRGAEVRYSTLELECLAVVWAIDRFRPYLEYTTFILESDAQALKWLMSTPEPSGRFGRWAVKIQCGAFKILYRQGSQNKVADALSRAPLPVTEILIMWRKLKYFCNVGVKFCSDKSCKDVSKQEGGGEVDEPETLHSALTEILNDIPPTRSEIIEAQRSDPVWKKIRNYLNGSEEVRQKMDEYHNRVEWKHKIRGYILDVDENDQSKLLVFFRPTFEEELNDSDDTNIFEILPYQLPVEKAAARHIRCMVGEDITVTKTLPTMQIQTLNTDCPITSNIVNQVYLPQSSNPILQAFIVKVTEHLECYSPDRQEYIKQQKRDPFCRRIWNYLEYQFDPPEVKTTKQKLHYQRLAARHLIEEDLLLKYMPTMTDELGEEGRGLKIVVPRALIQRVMWIMHGHPLSSHGGIARTLYRTRQIYTWIGMKRDVTNFVRGCQRCQACKPRSKSQIEAAQIGPYGPFDCLSVDLTGPNFSHNGRRNAVTI
uniref:RNA-directed DNA polymerase n=1 Tax=Strigamia maritima TaxID=126957 RepID=T1JNB1_STRMM